MSTPSSPLRIGTRSSQLARWQAEFVSAKLRALGAEVSLVFIETTGDLDRTRDFGSLGAKGVFVKEIETALLEHRIDLAVHSLKDLPTELPEGLVLGAALERETPFDALVSEDYKKLSELPKGASLATGSLRRASQALALRSDLNIVPLRGNVPTRIRKIRERYADATLIAAAGVRRLGLAGELTQEFPPNEFTPAMGQGALAIEAREDEYVQLLDALEHAPTRHAGDAERLFVARIGGGCKTPVGVLVEPTLDEEWKITALVASPDGVSLLRHTREHISTDDLHPVAIALADEMYHEADDAIRATLERSARGGATEE